MSGVVGVSSGLSRAAMVRLARWGVILLALCGWQVGAVWLDAVQILPTPLSVGRAVGTLLGDHALVGALGATLLELAASFGLSLLLGGALGWVLGHHARLERVGMPIVLMIYAIPQITVLPLFILYFGLGPAGKIAFGVSHGMFPIALGVHAGIRSARPHLRRWVISLGASAWQRFVRLSLPQIIPAVCTSMRLAMSMTLLGVLLAERYVSSLGIGFYVQLYTNALQGDALFALVFMLAAIAVSLNQAVGVLERRGTRWQS